jgi:hypothetical protein
MVVPNAISGCKDIITLFWENKLGIDVDVCALRQIMHLSLMFNYIQDNYRIVIFEGADFLKGSHQKSYLTLADGPNRPSDKFLRLHFCHCLRVSVCRGDVSEDYGEQEIDNFIQYLGVYDGEIDSTDPRWYTRLGVQVYYHLIRANVAR